MARILLIRPGLGAYYSGVGAGLAVTHSPPVNLATLAAAATDAGHRVRVWDLEVAKRDDPAAELKSFRPDLVGLTFRTPQWRQARAIARLVRSVLPRTMLVAGGPHASSMPEDTLEGAPFDIVVRGEGEAPLVALASGTDPIDIPGVHRPDGAQLPPNPSEDLDHLPLPAWQHFDMAAYRAPTLVARRTPTADLESSRGCLARCLYCTKAVFGRRFAPLSPERFVASVDHARAFGFRSFNLVDDSFTTDIPRASTICELLAQHDEPLPWTATNGIRVTGVDEAFFRLARRSGCTMLAFGLESGSDELLRAVGKGANTEQGRHAVRAAHAAGISTLGYFMLGLPGESLETLEATIDFATSLDLDWAKFALTMPLPGTPLWSLWKRHLTRPFDPNFSAHRPAREWFAHPDLPWDTLEAARRRAYLTFYGRPAWVTRQIRALLD